MTWAKQSIIVKKTHAKDRDEAKGIAKGFSDRMYTSRETGTSYRFRQKNPGHFVPGSFRVKGIPKKGVTIVYGELQDKSAEDTSFIPPGTSYSTAGVTMTNIRRKQDTQPSPNTDIPLQGGSVTPISYTSKYGMNFKSDFAPESFAFIPPGSTFGPPGTASERQNQPTQKSVPEMGGRTPPVSVDDKHYSERKYGSHFVKGFSKRASWDIFRGNMVDSLPYQAQESGLTRCGGTGPIHEKRGFSMNSFYVGFEKKAALAETHGMNTAQDMVIGGILPFGTTVSTVAGDRPRDYNRGKEWLSRMGGAIGGGLLGAAAGASGGSAGLQIGSRIGSIAGEGIGSHLSTREYYDASGKLKPQYRKQR